MFLILEFLVWFFLLTMVQNCTHLPYSYLLTMLENELPSHALFDHGTKLHSPLILLLTMVQDCTHLSYSYWPWYKLHSPLIFLLFMVQNYTHLSYSYWPWYKTALISHILIVHGTKLHSHLIFLFTIVQNCTHLPCSLLLIMVQNSL